ncbi:MAG: siphovirus Gp157 family protein [Cetobacterium sp.]
MATLYELTQETACLERLLEDIIDYETGEISDSDVYSELEDELKEQIKQKSTGIIKFIRNTESDVEQIKTEAKRLSELAKRKEKKIDNLKKYVALCLEVMGTKKIETNLGNISIRKSISTVIDEKVLDKKYAVVEQVYKFNKTEIKKLLETGEVIEGAKLVENSNITVR